MLQQLASAGEFESIPDVSVTTQMCIAVQQYQSPLLRYAEQILRHEPDQAHDVVQDVFVRLHQALHDGQCIGNVKSWLYRLTHNLAIDRYRKTQRRARLNGTIFAQEEPVRPEIEARSRGEAAQLAVSELGELPAQQREVVMLKIVQELTFQEIADITGEKIPTLHYRLNQGLRALARRLKAKGV
jgi:RNA polymerase sigma-70 factor (ECF subfamily)